MNLKELVVKEFVHRFGAQPTHVLRAPGRVNLIGEHTDYNDGFVMPMAIDRATWIALSPRDDRQVEIYSMDHHEDVSFNTYAPAKNKGWREYPKGVAWALAEHGYDLKGFNGTIVCDVPLGAGLSSSASFELAVARAFSVSSGFPWDAPKMAVLCQKAENVWVGVNCGIMDQMISAVGRKNHAVLIDCRDLSTTSVPLPPGVAVVILDTTTRRGLVESAYNERRRQCEQACAHFGVKALRDVSLSEFAERSHELDDTIKRRARHVITENLRTIQAADCMTAGNASLLGKLMDLSHNSLRDDFEVTNGALNTIVDISRGIPGCLGARMTGAGFGGCAVALVDDSMAAGFTKRVTKEYEARTHLMPAIYICHAANGAELVDMVHN